MTGAQLKDVLEDVADNIFHPDPYFQGGGDMVRIGGMGYAIDISKPMGSRISRPDASQIRQADRGGQELHRRRLGQHQRKHRRARRSGTWSRTCVRTQARSTSKPNTAVKVTGV